VYGYYHFLLKLVGEGRRPEEGEHKLHNAQPMPPNDSERKVTVAEQTGQRAKGKLKFSRTMSLPASKTRIPQRHVQSASLCAVKQPSNSAHPITGGMRESKIPIPIGRKKKNSMPLRSASEGGETRILSSMPACSRTDTTAPKSTRQIQKPMHSESSVAQVTPAATVATGHKHSTPKHGDTSKPQRTVCGLNIHDTPITNAEKLFEFYSRRIVRWQPLAKYLNVHDNEIERINQTYRLDEEKCFQMLYSWSKSACNRATYGCLAEGFREIEQEYLIKDLHSHLTAATPQTDYANQWVVDIETIGDCIENIHISVKALLERKYKTATIRVSYNK